MRSQDLLGTSFNNICTCGKKFTGTCFPKSVLTPDKDGVEIPQKKGRFRLDFIDATVKDGCDKCQKRLADEEEEKYYAELDALPIEERIRRVEKWIRNFRHQEQRYIEPPRY